jgi:hypothetical protein
VVTCLRARPAAYQLACIWAGKGVLDRLAGREENDDFRSSFGGFSRAQLLSPAGAALAMENDRYG